MLSFKTGSEPEHKVTINPRHVVYVKPQGPRGAWTWVHVAGDEKFLVSDTYDDVVEMLNTWEARHAHD